MKETRFENSDALCRYMTELTGGTAMLSFSCGKDSIGCWIQLRRYFKNIYPVYMYLVPGLEFVEESLRYYEKKLGSEIYRLPHPSLYRLLRNGVFQTPDRWMVTDQVRGILPELDYDDLAIESKNHFKLPPETYNAVGIRSADSPMRRTVILKHGSVNHRKLVFWPVYDWNADRLFDEIKNSGIKLPKDYDMFGRSFDGIDRRFLEKIRVHCPKDYKRILEFFPMAELELKRWP